MVAWKWHACTCEFPTLLEVMIVVEEAFLISFVSGSPLMDRASPPGLVPAVSSKQLLESRPIADNISQWLFADPFPSSDSAHIQALKLCLCLCCNDVDVVRSFRDDNSGC